MRDKLNEILTAYGNYCVESVLLVPTDVSNRKINKAQAKEQILHLLDKSLPSHKRQVHVEHGEIMPSVAQCKWYFDGYEQAIADVRKVIKETSND